LKSNTLKQVVEFVLNLRTIVAALRRRRRGENSPPSQSEWGYSPWLKRIERHWGEPDFGLAAVVPWVSEARRLWDNEDSTELERLVLAESWKQFSRLSSGRYFDFAAVVLYVLRWSLINRRVNYDAQTAQKNFNSLVDVGYSYFRQAFKAQTGLSPKQYQLQIRLQKAQDLLANTSKSVGEIAEILGFNTAYHLSSQFKQHIGLAPQIWRNKLAQRSRRRR
jgi:AraC-like DNA-binding protein